METKRKYINFFIGEYARVGEISKLTIFTIPIYQRVGNIRQILFLCFDLYSIIIKIKTITNRLLK